MVARPSAPVLRKLALSLVAALVALGLCEAALWALGYSYSPLHINPLAQDSDSRLYHAFEDEHFRADPELIWVPCEHRRPFNDQGFRGEELARTKGPNEYRIFALGDSNTLGWEDRQEGGATIPGAHWPRYLGEILPRGQRKYTVINAGVWGYTSFQGRRRLEQILEFQPDMVLVSFGGNDAHRVAVSDADYIRMRPVSLLLKTHMGQLAWATWDRWTVNPESLSDENLVFRVSPEEYRDNLQAMLQACRQHGIHCVLLTRPFWGLSSDATFWKTHAPRYVAATLEVGRTHEVPVVDLNAAFKDHPEFFIDESHFTEAGHRLAARRIYEHIRPLLPP